MRLLLDEAVAFRLAAVLTDLGHPSDHVRDLGISGASDQEVVSRAQDYDALVTLDLHRQASEWLVVNEAMLMSAKVIRMRFASAEDEGLIGQARALLVRWQQIEHAIMQETEARLVTITRAGSHVRVTTVDEVREVLRNRRG